MSENGRRTEVKGLSLTPKHWAMIDNHTKDSGLLSRSAGLRDILDDWARRVAADAQVELGEVGA